MKIKGYWGSLNWHCFTISHASQNLQFTVIFPTTGMLVPPYPHMQDTFLPKCRTFSWFAGITLETEGSIWKMQKRALFHNKKVKTGTRNLTSPYIHSLFTIFLIKQIFEKNKSCRAASGSRVATTIKFFSLFRLAYRKYYI